MPSNGLRRVLIVDDEDLLRQIMARTLEDRGFEVLSAADGLEAWKVLQESAESIHAVVTDVKMPRMGGLALAERIRTLPNPPPLLFVSGYGQHDLTPVQPFLPKPFHPDELVALVLQLLDGNAQQPARVH
jgi:two-component system, cell cycle sensor histidine kinase and response regulator CckA